MTVASVKLSPIENTKGKKISADVFHLDQLPTAMEKMGWKVAPQLMRHWFSIKPAYKLTKDIKDRLISGDAWLIPKERVNDTIVKMAWARPYINDKLQEKMKSWDSKAGIKLLHERLNCAGYGSPENKHKKIFLGTSNSAIELDATAQVNTIRVGGLWDTINDWYGAIGNASLQFAVRGCTGTHQKRPAFFVEQVGVYLKDIYDFVDDNELLGVWSKNRVLSKAESAVYFSSYSSPCYISSSACYISMLANILARDWSGFVPIYNSDFRDWQDKHNTGGDFFVFSDVLWLNPLPHQRIIYL